MNKLQKWGGAAALYAGLAYIIGIVGFLGVVNVGEISDPVQRVIAIVENQDMLTLLNLIVYVFFGVALVVLTLALHERLQGDRYPLARTATVLGIIWSVLVIASGMIYNIGMATVVSLYATDPSQASTVWLAIESISNGLGGGVEIVGGLWVLLLSIAAMQHGGLPRAFNYFGLLVGLAGLVTIIPALGEIGGITFGLSQIVWFIWLGIVLLRRPAAVSQSLAPAFE